MSQIAMLRMFFFVLLVGIFGILQMPHVYAANGNNDIEMYVYQVEWDDASFASLTKNIDKIDVVVAERLMVTSRGLEETDPENATRTQTYLQQHPDVKAFVHVHNFNDDAGVREGGLVKRLLADPSQRNILIEGLVDYAVEHHLDGISVDFENLDAEAWQSMISFLDVLRTRMRAENQAAQVVVNLPLIDEETVEESEVPFVEISKNVDKIIIMSYDQHRADSEAGPVSGMPRYISGLERLGAVLDEKKIIVALGNYGYDWDGSRGAGVSVTWQEATSRAASSSKKVSYHPSYLSPNFTYTDTAGHPHTVWYLDGLTFWWQVFAAQQRGMSAFALWRMGSEDPRLWTFVSTYPVTYAAAAHERYLLDTFITKAKRLSAEKLSMMIAEVAGYRETLVDARRIFFVDELVRRMLDMFRG